MGLSNRVIVLFLCSGWVAAGEPWRPVPNVPVTRWGRDVTPESVHPEYPRPLLVRPAWVNLNGLWDYAIVERKVGPDGDDDGERPKEYSGKILVPFPVESSLSGAGQRLGPRDVLWYHRVFDAPPIPPGQRLFLHFGAADFRTRVWVNGRSFDAHQGGFDSFSFDITGALNPGVQQDLVVRVWDPTDEDSQPRGKQSLTPQGTWHTAVSGIWQTVWLEVVPALSIEGLRTTPDISRRRVSIVVEVPKGRAGMAVDAAAMDADREVAATRVALGQPCDLVIPEPRLWSPEDPHLYDLRVRLLDEGKVIDEVRSYFALREIQAAADALGVPRLLLNHKPYYMLGILDAGYWPDGLYTAPSDAAIRYDLGTIRRLGFNTVRKHQKIEPSRWYFWCDRLGLIVWQDLPCAFQSESPWRVIERDRQERQSVIPRVEDEARSTEVSSQRGGKEAPEGVRERTSPPLDVGASGPRAAVDLVGHPLHQALTRMIEERANHPSIAIWILFNEGWGKTEVPGLVEAARRLDPSRLLLTDSGGPDSVLGDLLSLHAFPCPAAPPRAKRETARPGTVAPPAVLSAFGGLGLRIPEHVANADRETQWRNWAYRVCPSRDALASAYAGLCGDLRELRWDRADRPSALAGSVYHQWTDVEEELDGIMTADRAVLKVDVERMDAIHRRVVAPLDLGVAIDPAGGKFRDSVRVMIQAMPSLPDAEVRYTVDGTEPSQASPAAAGELWVSRDAEVRARAFRTNGQTSPIASAQFQVEDTTPPAVESVRAFAWARKAVLLITFTEPVTPETALDAGRYSLDNAEVKRVESVSPRAVRLLASGLDFGRSSTLRARGIQDQSPNHAATGDAAGFQVALPAPVIYYSCDEVRDERTPDGSGNDLDGAFHGNAAPQGGKVRQAVRIDRENWISVRIPPVKQPSQAMTVALWIRPDHWDGEPRIMESYSLFIWKDPRRMGRLCFDLAEVQSLNIPPPEPAVWHHLAWTFGETKMRLYLNGALQGEIPAYGRAVTTYDPLLIGRKVWQETVFPFHGLMDEIVIFDRSLTPDEIRILAGDERP